MTKFDTFVENYFVPAGKFAKLMQKRVSKHLRSDTDDGVKSTAMYMQMVSNKREKKFQTTIYDILKINMNAFLPLEDKKLTTNIEVSSPRRGVLVSGEEGEYFGDFKLKKVSDSLAKLLSRIVTVGGRQSLIDSLQGVGLDMDIFKTLLKQATT